MKYLYYILLAFYSVSCGQGNKQKNITDISISGNKDNTVNVINQAKPKLMIIPSDRMLKDEKCLTINTFNGKKTIIRDISGFIVKSEKSNSIISAIQKYFIQIGYPLNDLEQLAMSYPGVTKTYAIQAGRELRVIVGADKIDDKQTESLSTEIAKKIQDEMTYPGQVKITVIRETRAVSFAK